MNLLEKYDAAYATRAWGPTHHGEAVTVIFKRRGARLRSPDVSAPVGPDYCVAEAKVRLVDGQPAVTWRRPPTSEEYLLAEFVAAAIRAADQELPMH